MIKDKHWCQFSLISTFYFGAFIKRPNQLQARFWSYLEFDVSLSLHSDRLKSDSGSWITGMLLEQQRLFVSGWADCCKTKPASGCAGGAGNTGRSCPHDKNSDLELLMNKCPGDKVISKFKLYFCTQISFWWVRLMLLFVFKGAMWTFLVSKQKVCFHYITLGVTHFNALCVFLRSKKTGWTHFLCIKKHFQRGVWKYF